MIYRDLNMVDIVNVKLFIDLGTMYDSFRWFLLDGYNEIYLIKTLSRQHNTRAITVRAIMVRAITWVNINTYYTLRAITCRGNNIRAITC